jgi:hypothetical protein
VVLVVVPLREPEPVHGDQATAGPQELSPVVHCGGSLAQCPEQMAAGHRIETRGREVGRRRIAATVNGEAACSGVGRQLLEHRGRQVARRDAMAESRGVQSHVAGSRGHIEHFRWRTREDRGKRVNPGPVFRRAELGDVAPSSSSSKSSMSTASKCATRSSRLISSNTPWPHS